MAVRDRYAFKVGLVSILLLLSVGGLLVWKSGLLFKVDGYEVIGEFKDVSGLLEGSEVRYRGYKVGRVFNVTPGKNGVLVRFWIKNGVYIRKGSIARVVFDGLVGEKFIALRPNPDENAPLIRPGDHIEGYASAGLADAIEITTLNLQHTEAILKTFQEILTSTTVSASIKDSILSFSSAMTNLNTLLAQAKNSGIIGQLSNTVQGAQKLTNSPDLPRIIKNLSEASEKINGLLSDSPSSSTHTNIRMLKEASKIKLTPQLGFQAWPSQERLGYHGQLDLSLGRQLVRTTVSDRSGRVEWTAQYGRHLGSGFTGRVGAFDSKPGVGLDYKLTSLTALSVDVYDPDHVKVDISGRIKVHPQGDLFLTLKNNPQTPQKWDTFGAGILIRP